MIHSLEAAFFNHIELFWQILNDITGNLDAKQACKEALKIHKKYLNKVSFTLFYFVDLIKKKNSLMKFPNCPQFLLVVELHDICGECCLLSSIFFSAYYCYRLRHIKHYFFGTKAFIV
jgi:hypothetical protein